MSLTDFRVARLSWLFVCWCYLYWLSTNTLLFSSRWQTTRKQKAPTKIPTNPRQVWRIALFKCRQVSTVDRLKLWMKTSRRKPFKVQWMWLPTIRRRKVLHLLVCFYFYFVYYSHDPNTRHVGHSNGWNKSSSWMLFASHFLNTGHIGSVYGLFVHFCSSFEAMANSPDHCIPNFGESGSRLDNCWLGEQSLLDFCKGNTLWSL